MTIKPFSHKKLFSTNWNSIIFERSYKHLKLWNCKHSVTLWERWESEKGSFLNSHKLLPFSREWRSELSLYWATSPLDLKYPFHFYHSYILMHGHIFIKVESFSSAFRKMNCRQGKEWHWHDGAITLGAIKHTCRTKVEILLWRGHPSLRPRWRRRRRKNKKL